MDPEEMDDLHDLLLRGVGKARKQRRSRDYLFEEGSRAHSEWFWYQRGPAFGPGFTAQAYQIAGLQLAAAEDLMLALEGALEGGHVIAPFVLARAALEALGRANHLLDPDLGARGRAEAAMSYELKGFHALLQVDRSAPLDPGSEEAQAGDQVQMYIRTLEDDARRLGFDVTPGKGRAAPMVGHQLPGFSQAVHDLLPLGEPRALGRTLATAYSAFAHADPVMFRTLGTAAGYGIRDMSELDSLEFDEQEVLAIVSPVVVGHLATYERQILSYGWGKTMWDKWSRHARFVLRRHISRAERNRSLMQNRSEETTTHPAREHH